MYHIPGRYSFDGIVQTGTDTSQGHTDISFAITRLSNKHKEVRIKTDSKIQFLGVEIKSSSRQSTEDKISGNIERQNCELASLIGRLLFNYNYISPSISLTITKANFWK